MGWGVAGDRGASYLRLYLSSVADCSSTAWVRCLPDPVSCSALESPPLQEQKDADLLLYPALPAWLIWCAPLAPQPLPDSQHCMRWLMRHCRHCDSCVMQAPLLHYSCSSGHWSWIHARVIMQAFAHSQSSTCAVAAPAAESALALEMLIGMLSLDKSLAGHRRPFPILSPFHYNHCLLSQREPLLHKTSSSGHCS